MTASRQTAKKRTGSEQLETPPAKKRETEPRAPLPVAPLPFATQPALDYWIDRDPLDDELDLIFDRRQLPEISLAEQAEVAAEFAAASVTEEHVLSPQYEIGRKWDGGAFFFPPEGFESS